ncbi:uncharacterized protein F5891DRAFT_982028 [Suillus fuscotomentosus]|uniref:Uncharacterized protein n=1 Tax=Suillus fuscotomentosus TaxID=1912939 RepID=A0AAD4HJU2_9AGAM|nr:uncharacterized protein F5891DRAFT_982028 [Suillus fuscotomentosus]KAG1898109.1 hypothetical protein F5891DRAFT_982028 [Suillus fuscotomentosus]
MYDIKCERDRAELRIEMMQMSGSTRRQHVQMPKRKNLHQEWYPEGGGSTRWLTDEGESTTSEGRKPPCLQKIGPSGRLKYSDRPYFEDITDEPIKPIQKEGSGTNVQCKDLNVLRPFLLTSKVICDNTYSNKSWPRSIVAQGMFQLQEINQQLKARFPSA